MQTSRIYHAAHIFASLVLLIVALGPLFDSAGAQIKEKFVWGTVDDGNAKNFRTTSDAITGAGSIVGLRDLHASGSAELSAARWKGLLSSYHQPITVVDLREEEHIFVNGMPVNVTPADWDSIRLSHESIVTDERKQAQALKVKSEIAIAQKNSEKTGGRPAEVAVKAVSTEEDIVKSAGARYIRLTVKDGGLPTDSELDRFIAAVRDLPQNSWVHFHCQAGHGRTTRFLALYDMLRNANRVSLHDILDRQSLLVHEPALLTESEEEHPERLQHFETFYEYTRQNPGGRPLLWTEWKKNHPNP